MTNLTPLDELPVSLFKSPAIFRKLTLASRSLAELKGIAATVPNQGILIGTLGAREAKDSSEEENIVTTHDEVFRESVSLGAPRAVSPAAKEVRHYRDALQTGFSLVKQDRLLTVRHILAIQSELERNHAGFRKLPGTTLKNSAGDTVYVPPQDEETIIRLMRDLERFMNEATDNMDPLVKMALIHHRFKSIHPFYDGNGRTGRIINVLYLIKEGLIDLPILYISSYIVRTKADYYRLLQAVRDDGAWEEWILYMLTAVEQTAKSTLNAIRAIGKVLLHTKHQVRNTHKFYSQDLINNLFTHPYTRIEFIERDLKVSRLTARKYLDALVADSILEKRKMGRSNYYINRALYQILSAPFVPL
jgi:Fic family protein